MSFKPKTDAYTMLISTSNRNSTFFTQILVIRDFSLLFLSPNTSMTFANLDDKNQVDLLTQGITDHHVRRQIAR